MRPGGTLPALLSALLLVAGAGPAGAADRPGFRDIAVRTASLGSFLIGRSQTRFGEFEFRGGLVLTSTEKGFGGLSGIDFLRDGKRFISISDTGYWLRGEVERTEGRLTGVSGTEWAPILDAKGKPLGSKRRADAEGLRLATVDGAPGAYVSFERVNDLRLFRFGRDLALSRPREVRLPKDATGLVRNRGLETVAIAPKAGVLAGAPVLVTERSLDAAGNHRAFIVGGPLAGDFSVVRRDDYDVTDGAFLPNGDLLLLERWYQKPMGIGMRIRRIPGDTIRPGAVVDGPVVLQGDFLNQIDNMEGLAITEDADGTTRITLVSDDNLSLMQRTLLLEFVWLGPQKNASLDHGDLSEE